VHSVLAADPQVARPGHRILRNGRSLVGFLLFGKREQVVELLGAEPGQVEIEIRGIELLEFERQQLLVPVRPGNGPIHHQAESLDLRRRPLIAQDDGHLVDAELAGGFQTKVAIHDFAIAAGQNWDLKAELANAAAHPIDGGVVLTRVANVEDELRASQPESPLSRPPIGSGAWAYQTHQSGLATHALHWLDQGKDLSWVKATAAAQAARMPDYNITVKN
jgi:hypothetical protein